MKEGKANMDNFDINKLMQDKDMSELFGKVKKMVDEGNIPDEMKEAISSFSNSSNNSNYGSYQANGGNSKNNETQNSDFQFDANTMYKMKNIIEKMSQNKNDPRANLLESLKPYLKETRKEKVDQYIKMLNMSKVIEMFNDSGGETKK